MSDDIKSIQNDTYVRYDLTLCKHMNKYLVPLSKWLLSFTAYVMLAMMFLIVADVLLRTFFDAPIIGTAEITEYVMILMVFPCFVAIQVQDTHLNVTMLTSRYDEPEKSLFGVFSWTMAFIFMLLLTFEMFNQTYDKYIEEEIGLLLDFPIWIIYLFASFCLVGFSLSFLTSFLEEFAKNIKYHILGKGLFVIVIAITLSILPFALASSKLGLPMGALGGLLMCYLFLLILTGLPIGMSMLVAGIQGTLLAMPSLESSLALFGVAPYSSVGAAHLSVIPMFILMGELALIGGISKDLFRTASVWLGALPGGLAVASVAGCAGFAAVCGESIPTAMTMAAVALPAMEEKGYDKAFGCASIAMGGTLGILIPPSLGFIMYSIVSEQSVGKLFLAGIVPGILLVIVMSVIIIIRSIRNPSLAPRGNSTTWTEKITSLTGVLPMVGLFTIIMGGILSGFCSPTEGGAVGAFFTLAYCLARRRITFESLLHALKSSSILSAKIFLILMGVAILGYFLVATQLPFLLTDFIIAHNTGKYFILFATIILFVLLGCLMNVIPMIMLTLPSLYPAIIAVGFDPIWFGVITVLLMELGQVTPPIGVLVFAMSGVVPDVPVQRIYKHVAPFFLAIFACIGLFIIFPEICLFLPNNL